MHFFFINYLINPFEIQYQNSKIHFALQLLELLHKRAWQFNQKKKLWQNTACLQQQIYTSQENFTQPLVVMVETFRRSALQCCPPPMPCRPAACIQCNEHLFVFLRRIATSWHDCLHYSVPQVHIISCNTRLCWCSCTTIIFYGSHVQQSGGTVCSCISW